MQGSYLHKGCEDSPRDTQLLEHGEALAAEGLDGHVRKMVFPVQIVNLCSASADFSFFGTGFTSLCGLLQFRYIWLLPVFHNSYFLFPVLESVLCYVSIVHYAV